MCKALCGVAAGSCGGAISLYWAEETKTDISDINAKFGAQVCIHVCMYVVSYSFLFLKSNFQDNSNSILTCWFTTMIIIHISRTQSREV